MSEYRRYNLTLTVADPSARDRFRALSRPESFYEIRPNRQPGQRGAYSVEMTQSEYEQALRDAEDPSVNLIVVEPDPPPIPEPSVPGGEILSYVAANEAGSMGLTGSGVTIGQLDSGIDPDSPIYAQVFTARSFSEIGDPYHDVTGHGTAMTGLSVPPGARLAFAQIGRFTTGPLDSSIAAGTYWLVDEIGVGILLIESAGPGSTVLADAVAHAVSRNILVVSANGNGGATNTGGPGQNLAQYPAAYPGVLAISNYSTETDAIQPSSNYGSHTWAAAPGGVVNTYTTSGGEDSGRTDVGTSAASAVATGVIARFMTGGRSAGNVKSFLASNARKTGASPIYEGNGVLQLLTAEQKLQAEKPYPQNQDGSIPLPNGGILSQPARSDTELPAGTNVYPEGTPTYNPSTIGLPDGGVWQEGNNSISGNSTITPVPPDGAGDPDPGACLLSSFSPEGEVTTP